MTAKIPSSGLIWLFGFIYILGLSCQLCQGNHYNSQNEAMRRPSERQNLLSWWYAHKRAPGSEFLGKRSSDSLSKRVPGSEFLGKRVPGSEFLGKRVPGSEFLGKRVPGSEFLGKRVPGSEFLGKRVPGSEFLGKRVPGSEFLGKRVPGSEFLGKRHILPLTLDEEEELYHVMEDLTKQKRSLEVPLPYAQKTDRLRYELNEDHGTDEN